MLPLLVILGISFLVSCVLTPVARALSFRCGLVDSPDTHRKMHAKPVPVAGGIAVLASTCLVLAGALLISGPLQESLGDCSSLLLGLFLAALLLCTLGVLDDCHGLRGRHKLFGQIVAVGIVIAFDVQVHNIQVFGLNIELGLLAIPFTFFWLLGAVNSLNLIDGMDGLLGSVGAIISVAMAFMAVLSGHWAAACVAMALAGALLGFLRYNLPPATIFLGDAGSMVIGLVVGVLGIQSALKGPATIALVAPLAMLTIPVLDTAAAVVRRKLTGRSIYTTDRGHLHHCLLRRGLSTWFTLLLISFLCLLSVLGALASLALKNELVAVLTVFAVITILVMTRLFGYAELLLIKKRLIQTVMGFMPGAARAGVRHIEMHLQGTTAWTRLLHWITAPALDLNLQTVCLDVNAPALHEEYHGQWDRTEEPLQGTCLWYADLPLVINGNNLGRLKVAGYPDTEDIAGKIARLTRLMEEFDSELCADAESAPMIATSTRIARIDPGDRRTEKREDDVVLNPVHASLAVRVDLAGRADG